jgi:hypothetical protein
MRVKSLWPKNEGIVVVPPIHRLETAFGGGKTHTLIALTHLGYRGTEIAEAAADVIDSNLLQPAGSVEVVSQIFRRLQPALICGQNYPAKAINCL